MLERSWQVAVCLWLALTVEAVTAQQLAGSQDRLQMLKKIQGSWVRDCHKVFNGDQTVFEQTRLRVSYTDMVFRTREYSNRDCTLVVSEYETQYKYNLGEAVDSTPKKYFYELDLQPVVNEQGLVRMPRKNLVHFDDGYLYFGLRQAVANPEARLQELDLQFYFQRF